MSESWPTVMPSTRKPHRCPICNGRGTVPPDFYAGYKSPTSPQPPKCRSCSGSGVIIA